MTSQGTVWLYKAECINSAGYDAGVMMNACMKNTLPSQRVRNPFGSLGSDQLERYAGQVVAVDGENDTGILKDPNGNDIVANTIPALRERMALLFPNVHYRTLPISGLSGLSE